MNNRQSKINDLASLGEIILMRSDGLSNVINKACQNNAWFTRKTVDQSLKAIAKKYLNRSALEEWQAKYSYSTNESKSIGLILAGNIPLVGFHDVLSVFLSGHRSLIKLSDKDKYLLPFLVDALVDLNPEYKAAFEFTERLKTFDAVIATGSNTSGSYFEKYFSHVPHIIRKNRNAVAVIYNDISDSDLVYLGEDIFNYFGLGCRNVSKLYLEQGFAVNRIFEAILSYSDIRDHNKYMNNYTYNNALYLLNKEPFLTNDFLILKESKDIASRIASVHYEFFSDKSHLFEELHSEKDKIQCIVCDRIVENSEFVQFGSAQSPGLSDYADGVDTMEFLIGLK